MNEMNSSQATGHVDEFMEANPVQGSDFNHPQQPVGDIMTLHLDRLLEVSF